MTPTSIDIIKLLHVSFKFSCIKFMIYSFNAPTIESISTYDSCTLSIPTVTPRPPLTAIPTEDITTPAPTVKTDNYGIYVNIPGPPLTDTTPPFVYQTPSPTFVPTASNILYE